MKKLSRKSFTPFFLTHRIAHPTTKHTPTHLYQVPHSSTTAPTLPWLLLLSLLAASQRGALLAPPDSSAHDRRSARYRCHFANKVYGCCSFGGSRLSCCCCCWCCCCCSHINSHNQVRGHRTGSSHFEAENTWVQRHEQSFGGFRRSPMPPPRVNEGSSHVKHALLAKNARSTELPIDFQLLCSSTSSHQPPLGTAQKLKN